MMKLKHAWALGLIALSLGAQAQLSFGQNLVVNGGAEDGVTGWTAFDGYNQIQSVDYGANWVLPSQPGPIDRGSKMFTGVGARSAAYELFDLGAPIEQAIQYDLSGWLGGWAAQQDNALFYVSFLDASSQEIGHAALGPVTPEDRANNTGLFLRQATGLLPVGTSSLMFSLSMERLDGGDNDGYADNLVFSLSVAPVPEAGSLSYAFAGLLTMGMILRSRQRRQG